MSMRRTYAFKCDDSGKLFAKACGVNMKVPYKNTVDAANAIRGLTAGRAVKYLNDVMKRKQYVPSRMFRDDFGRCAQANQSNVRQGSWTKSCKFLLDLLIIALSNAEFSEMEIDQLIVVSIQVNQASSRDRTTYRPHGAINRYMTHGCYAEIILFAKEKV